MAISEECWLKAAGIYSHLDEVYRAGEEFGRTKDFDVLAGRLAREREYFDAVIREDTHPGRFYYTPKDAEEITVYLSQAKSMAEKNNFPNVPFRVLKDKLFNVAIEKAVACECKR